MAFFDYLARAVRVGWIGLRYLTRYAVDRVRGRDPQGPTQLRMALEEMSGSFLKFGQILSLQVDTLPRAYCDALLDLLDRVPPFSPDAVRIVFDEELGRGPEEIYSEFDYSPIAAASIGQVHRAVLKDGSVVAVKVQRPGIREVFTRDAVLLNLFVRVVFALRIRTLYFLRDPLREFNEWIQDELDYRTEAAYARLLRRNAEKTPAERVPLIYTNLSSARVLTMELLEGESVREYLRVREGNLSERLEALDVIGFDPSIFVSNVIQNFVSDALRFGVFHADLHPANLLILKNNQVGYVDFGIVGHLTSEARRRIIQMTLGYVRGQNDDIFSSFMSVSTLTDHADPEGFRRRLEQLSRHWYREPAVGGTPQFGHSLTVLMIDLLTLCRSYGVLPRREMIKYIRSLFLADGLVSRLAPGLDYGPHLQRACEEYLLEEASRKTLSMDIGLPVMADMAAWLQSGPGSMLRSLDMLQRQELPIRVNLTERTGGNRTGNQAFWIGLGWLVSFLFVTFNWNGLVADPLSAASLVGGGALAGWSAGLVTVLWKLTR